MTRESVWALHGFILGLVADIMVEDQMFAAWYALPILCSALFCLTAALLPTMPKTHVWLQGQLSAARRHPARAAMWIAVVLGVTASALRIAAPTHRLTPLPSPRSAVYIRTATTPMIVRCDGTFVARLEQATPFVTCDVGAGDHVISAEDPHSPFRYEHLVTTGMDAPTALVMIPAVPGR